MNDHRLIREAIEWEALELEALRPNERIEWIEWHPTRRQRLMAKWRDFRWRLGHKIAGHDCDDDY